MDSRDLLRYLSSQAKSNIRNGKIEKPKKKGRPPKEQQKPLKILESDGESDYSEGEPVPMVPPKPNQGKKRGRVKKDKDKDNSDSEASHQVSDQEQAVMKTRNTLRLHCACTALALRSQCARNGLTRILCVLTHLLALEYVRRLYGRGRAHLVRYVLPRVPPGVYPAAAEVCAEGAVELRVVRE